MKADPISCLSKQDLRCQNQLWLGANLVVNIVSPDDLEHDLITKRSDYAEAAIPKYWIVNPIGKSISALSLIDDHYTEHGLQAQR